MFAQVVLIPGASSKKLFSQKALFSFALFTPRPEL